MKTLFSLLLILTVFVVSAQKENTIQVKVNPQNGDYTITSSFLHYSIGGSIHQPLNDVQTINGKDAAGEYKSIRFTWKNNLKYTGSIRWYTQRPVVIFDWTLPDGCTQQSPAAFPDFTSLPALPYRFSYHNRIFPLPQFFLEETSTPWMLFNGNADACLISPASDFIVSLMTHRDSTAICSGLNPEVKQLPPGFTHSTIMVLDNGIRKTWDEWGDALRALYGRKRPANDCDAILNYFGYWTDNGADYYYNYDTTKGYAGTLLAVREHYKKSGIPLGYMQLDSWWYKKTRYNIEGKLGADIKKPEFPRGPWNRSGGLLEYRADTFLFPQGLAAFQKKLGLPLITHNRWIDSTSPYQKQYKISGFAAIDPAYWKNIMSYLKSSGVINYEQDWMNYMYMRNPEMISDIRIGNAFTDGMANAAKEQGINLQYCMALPRYFMQGVKYNNLTTIRASGDGFRPSLWKNFIFASQLAYEMGIWPWSDVFKSNEMGNLVLSVLSAGPVGTGDELGKENKKNILMACRTDGVLVKPDVPILPMDQNYMQMAQAENKPLLAYTFTQHNNITTAYVFAFAERTSQTIRFGFQPKNTGIQGQSVVYNPRQNTVQVLNADDTFRDELPVDSFAYYIVAPVTNAGIAFLGDAEKIAATGRKRVADIVSTGKALQVKILFAKEEASVTLKGYSPSAVIADKGKIDYDAGTHLFTLVLPAPANTNSVVVNLKIK